MAHSVHRQTLLVECDSMDGALSLRPRLSRFNSAALLPIIGQVLSEADIPGTHVRIECLEVDLGEIELSDFEAVAEERLYRELKEAVARAMSSPFESGQQPEEQWRIEQAEWYLMRGRLPHKPSSPDSFSLGDLFADLAGSTPAALAELVRRVGREYYPLERIVYQLTVAELRQLIAVLDSRNAALIIAYMEGLQTIQAREPIRLNREDDFGRLLWLLTLIYLVRDAGSQFNRKSFAESLIRGVATESGLEYEVLLGVLGEAVEKTQIRRGLPSSLPATIGELVADSGLSQAPVAMERKGIPVKDEASFPTADTAALAQVVRLHAADVAWIERLVHALDESKLVALLELLDPEQASRIVAFLFDVQDVHQADPVHAGEPSRFNRLLWGVALAWVARDSGSQFNRKAFLRALVRRLAQNEGLDFAEVLVTMQSGLTKATARAPLRSSLPSILAGLLEDLSREHAAQPAPRQQELPETESRLHTGLGFLDSVLRWGNEAGRARVISEALRGLPLSVGSQLLHRLLPAAGVSDSPLRAAIADAVRNASEPRAVYGLLIAAALRGDDLDFESLRAESAELSPSSGPNEWDDAVLRTAIAARLATESFGDEGPQVPELVAELLKRAPDDGRVFLKSIMKRPTLREGLIRSCRSEDFAPLLSTLAGVNARAAHELVRTIGNLESSDRPPASRVNSVLIAAVLEWNAGRELTREFFASVIAELFPSPLPDRIRQTMLTACPVEITELRAALTGPAPADSHSTSDTNLRRLTARELLDQILVAGEHGGTPGELTVQALALQLEDPTREAADAIKVLLRDHQSRTRVLSLLPPSVVTALLRFLEPQRWRALLQAAKLFATATGRNPQKARDPQVWQAVQEALFEAVVDSAVSWPELTTRVHRHLASSAPGIIAPLASFRRGVGRQTDKKVLANLKKALLTQRRPDRPAAVEPASANGPATRDRAPCVKSAPRPEEDHTQIYISNAGLVLAAPFLPHLFTSLDMLRRDEKARCQWRDQQSASRAVHLLQYLVDERTSTPEPLLTLNKIMCGLAPATPVERGIILSERETEVCNQLLQAILANWKSLSNSSVSALRETFLQRTGKLERESSRWTLQVQRKTLDVLVDQVPWSFRMVLSDWMREPLHVTW